MSGAVCPAVELAPGYEIARAVTGCWQLAEDHGAASTERERLFARWERAVDAGYTTFDCADIYTGVEELLGRFLARLETPERARVHTKYVPDRATLAGLDRRQVERAVDRSLARLGREPLDLVQLHWWDFSIPGWVETAGWLDALRQKGKIRHLGLTNFDRERTAEVVASGIPVAAAQVQYSVLDRRPEPELAPWCRERGIGLLAYGTLAGGLLTGRYLGRPDPAWDGEPLPNRSLVKYRLMVDEVGGWEALQAILAALQTIGRRHGASAAPAAIRWVLEREGVAAAIVGVSRRDRLAALSRLWSSHWESERWQELNGLLARYPGPQGPVYGLERDPDGPHRAILRMDLRGEEEG